jgi:hypothetical protein
MTTGIPEPSSTKKKDSTKSLSMTLTESGQAAKIVTYENLKAGDKVQSRWQGEVTFYPGTIGERHGERHLHPLRRRR